MLERQRGLGCDCLQQRQLFGREGAPLVGRGDNEHAAYALLRDHRDPGAALRVDPLGKLRAHERRAAHVEDGQRGARRARRLQCPTVAPGRCEASSTTRPHRRRALRRRPRPRRRLRRRRRPRRSSRPAASGRASPGAAPPRPGREPARAPSRCRRPPRARGPAVTCAPRPRGYARSRRVRMPDRARARAGAATARAPQAPRRTTTRHGLRRLSGPARRDRRRSAPCTQLRERRARLPSRAGERASDRATPRTEASPPEPDTRHRPPGAAWR